ncbi:hypothetical protein CRM22_001870, partial [Opisthorchis felineus]
TLGAKADYKLAVKYFTMASQQGNVLAFFYLGVASSRVKLGDYYYYGWGTEVDYMKAVQHYRIASELHQNSQAMFNLAYMHEQGLGLKRDIHLAKRYYDLATEASLDAKVPVALALLKLSVSFWSEYLRASTLVSMMKLVVKIYRLYGVCSASLGEKSPIALIWRLQRSPTVPVMESQKTMLDMNA